MSTPASSIARAPVDQEICLGSNGGTEFFLTYSQHPWELEVEAFTVAAGAAGEPGEEFIPMLGGGLAQELSRHLGPELSVRFQRLVEEEAQRQGFSPDRPLSIGLPDDLERAIGKHWVFIATAFGPNGTLEYAETAAAAVARRAAQRKMRSVAISLLGTGSGGLNPIKTTRAIVRGIVRGAASRGLSKLTFTTFSESVMELAPELSRIIATPNAEVLAFPPVLEPHVREALLVAQSLAEEGVVQPTHVLRAIAERGVRSSNAFRHLRELLKRQTPAGSPVATRQGSLFSFSSNLYRQLNYALYEDGERHEPNRIWGRDLIAAALLARREGNDPFIAECGEQLETLRSAWFEYVTHSGGGRSREQWERWWDYAAKSPTPDARRESAPRPPISAPPVSGPVSVPARERIAIARTGCDDPWASDIDDRLGVSDEAKAFARLIAAEKFRPPLAVGVFGEWGSGKSFFMRLMHEHVTRLASGTPSAQAPEANQAAFLKGIVQIRFNAWHYVETNLWASLVDHMFTELDRWLRVQAKAGTKSTCDELLEKLSTARELTLEAAERLVRRRRDQRQAARRLARVEQELRSTGATGGRLPMYSAALGAALEGENGTKLRRELQQASKALGIDFELQDLKKNTQGAKELAQLLASDLQRGQLLREGLLHRLQRGWVLEALVVTLLAVPPVLVLLCEWLAGSGWKGLSELQGALVGTSAAIATVVGILGTALRQVHRAVSFLERIRTTLDETIERQLRNPAPRLAHRQKRLARITAQAAEARALLAATSERLAEATREYASETGSGRLLRFIRARATDGQYARHLGLVATIRKDFEELTANLSLASKQTAKDIEAARSAFEARVQQVIANSGDLLNEEEKQTLRASIAADALPDTSFRRIVLYIDDLDRCPPAKVVDVLQAVHMLLTFPLFVVIVAVDVRWVGRALERQYRDVLDRPGSADSARGPGASAHDYLEKIFQVPYWVRPMDPKACCGLITARSKELYELMPAGAPDHITPNSDTTNAEQPMSILDGHEEIREAEGSAAKKEDTGGGHNGGQVAPHLQEVPREPDTGTTVRPSQRDPEEPPSEPPPAVEPLDARALALDPREAEFMQALAPFVGASPRRTLRFLNVYCIVKASFGREDLDRLQAGGHRALMTQLAIATGAPSLLDAWLKALNTKAAQTLKSARDALESQLGCCPRGDLNRLQGALRAYEEASSAPESADAAVRDLVTYTSIARRYSFTG